MPRIALLLALTALAFATALGVPFYLDDFSILSDAILTSPDGWYRSWGVLQTRPLTWFSFWLNYQLGGENPAGYHAVNLALHLANIYLAATILPAFLPAPAAAIAATLFALHPIQTEPVLYVFARATLLMALFCLLSLRSWNSGRPWHAVAWFALALLAKEECVTFPLFLACLHLATKREDRHLPPIGAMLGLSVLAGLRGVYVTTVIVGSGAGAQAGIATPHYLATQGAAIWLYVRQLLIPTPFPLESPLHPNALYALGWIPILALAAWGLANPDLRRPPFWFTAGLALLLASSSVFPTADLSADRRLYLPLLAWGAAAGLLLAHWPRIVYPLAAILVLLTARETLAWQDPRAFWQRIVDSRPTPRAYIHYARQLPHAQALDTLNALERFAPDHPQSASEQGRIWLELGNAPNALAAFGRALALEPANARAVNNRGVALDRMGQREAALADFHRALSLDPCLFDARLNLKRLGQPVPTRAACQYTPQQKKTLEGN
ncbi:MAG: hypothetical protein JNK87_22645 [Bryobacterales bacterium]|nr:hypothetical protein [Bryobacterales bacterium]